MPAHKVHAHEVPAHKVHAHEVFIMRRMLIRCIPAPEISTSFLDFEFWIFKNRKRESRPIPHRSDTPTRRANLPINITALGINNTLITDELGSRRLRLAGPRPCVLDLVINATVGTFWT
jgi:hypothetical protein